MSQVLKTRMVGYAPDLRHPLAPREVVYVCEEAKRPLWRDIFSFYTLGTMIHVLIAGSPVLVAIFILDKMGVL